MAGEEEKSLPAPDGQSLISQSSCSVNAVETQNSVGGRNHRRRMAPPTPRRPICAEIQSPPDLRMPIDDPSRHRVEQREAKSSIDDE